MNRGLHTGFGSQLPALAVVGGGALWFATSQNFVIKADGFYRISGVGGGGSGGVASTYATSGGGGPCLAAGGSGGSFGMVERWLKKGDVVRIIIGAGGAGAVLGPDSGTTVGLAVNGNDGGATSISWPGGQMVIPGGKGGAAVASGSTAQIAAGGVQPSPATGADVTFRGGAGGFASGSSYPRPWAAGGGGACGSMLGDGGKGGNAAGGDAQSEVNGGRGGCGGGGSVGGGEGGAATGVTGAGAAVGTSSDTGGSAYLATFSPLTGSPLPADGLLRYTRIGSYTSLGMPSSVDPWSAFSGGGSNGSNSAYNAQGVTVAAVAAGAGAPGVKQGLYPDTLSYIDGTSYGVPTSGGPVVARCGGLGGEVVAANWNNSVTQAAHKALPGGSGGGGLANIRTGVGFTTYYPTSAAGGSGLVSIERIS